MKSSSAAPEDRMANGLLVADRYRLEKTIGKGSYGKVKLALDLRSGQRVALKFIARASIKKPAHTVRIRREINLLTALHHPYIVRLHCTLETVHDIILVMEYVPGKDLFDRIVGHPEQRLPEEEARRIFEQIVAAITYCHRHCVVHRDLKPENVMVDDAGQVRLIDFGFANMFHPRSYLETNCGSPLYAAPEIVQGVRYVGPEVDVWSLGVILYAMLTGSLPFEDEQLKGLYAKITAGSFAIPSHVSTGAKDLIRSMLCVNTAQRFDIHAIARHPWLCRQATYRSSFAPLCTVAHPDEGILHLMINYGFSDVDRTRVLVRTDPDDPATSIYHLLLEKEVREQRQEALLSRKRTNPAAPSTGLFTPPTTPDKLPDAPLKEASGGGNRGPLPSPLSFLPFTGPSDQPPHHSAYPPHHHHYQHHHHQQQAVNSSRIPSAATPWAMAPIAHESISSSPPAVPIIPLPMPRATPAGDPNCALAPPPTSIFASPGSIVSQAAATVANHFKKLRAIALRSNQDDPAGSDQTSTGGGGRSGGGEDSCSHYSPIPPLLDADETTMMAVGVGAVRGGGASRGAGREAAEEGTSRQLNSRLPSPYIPYIY